MLGPTRSHRLPNKIPLPGVGYFSRAVGQKCPGDTLEQYRHLSVPFAILQNLIMSPNWWRRHAFLSQDMEKSKINKKKYYICVLFKISIIKFIEVRGCPPHNFCLPPPCHTWGSGVIGSDIDWLSTSLKPWASQSTAHKLTHLQSSKQL